MCNIPLAPRSCSSPATNSIACVVSYVNLLLVAGEEHDLGARGMLHMEMKLSCSGGMKDYSELEKNTFKNVKKI